LDPGDLNTAVAVFFSFFVTLQPVGAALGRKIGMKTWVPVTMTIWGIATGLHVWVRHKWQLILLRIIIGTLEGVTIHLRWLIKRANHAQRDFIQRLWLTYLCFIPDTSSLGG
jgi:MFS family permease